ncbi:MAG: tetratricopeptide repeat protein [Chloroflexi bacterium]|nr:tetratricopeptide repeat protein [Chloroflexota bacterium]
MVTGRLAPRATTVWLLVVAILALLGAGALALRAGVHHRLYHALLYPAVVGRVTDGGGSPRERALQLHRFVYANVRLPADAYPVDDSPGGTLIRGFGYCDEAVMLFLRLLTQAEIPGRMTYLIAADGSSPHTIAEVLLDGEWRVFDTSFGITPRRVDGDFATRADVVAQPALLQMSQVKPEWYRDARVVLTTEPHQASLRAETEALIGTVIGRLPDWIVDALQDLYLRLPPPTYKGYDSYGQPVPIDDYSQPDSRLFFLARNYQTLRRSVQAQVTYEELLHDYPASRYADDAQYELGLLALTQQNDPATAVVALDRLFSEHPDSPWLQQALYFQGSAFRRLGDCAAATRRYEEVVRAATPEAERAHVQLARLPCAPTENRLITLAPVVSSEPARSEPASLGAFVLAIGGACRRLAL